MRQPYTHTTWVVKPGEEEEFIRRWQEWASWTALQGLTGSGMGQGPALALLLAGPALSLPSMLVLRSVLGTAKTTVYVSLVIAMATVTGLIFGAWL